jgi:hypothetical protein
MTLCAETIILLVAVNKEGTGNAGAFSPQRVLQ